MENLVPTLFHEIYKKHFGATYDSSQKSTWHWLTNQHIRDFSTPAYSRDDPPHMCVTMREGDRPKMFLWMLEEGGKKGGGRAPCCPSVLSLDYLPACSRDTMEHAVCSTKDTTALECLEWAVYNNQLGPGKSPSLSGYESYGQVLQHLVDKAFTGLQARCPVRTSAVFKPEERMKSVGTVPWKSQWTEKFPMTRDV